MGIALYRKYRSKKLSEVVGQDHITTTLNNALKSDRISHAYLFTGPRGVGKTSIARILAHEINQLPYDDDSTHIDIIEIDAASNRRIDEIRDLRDKVHIAPTSAKYKVYIIDEVHMLTKEAFNALLKTLEEPPAHVVFILATTDAHKVPETITSRTQKFVFQSVEESAVAKHLIYIAEKEGFSLDKDAAHLLAEHGGGSFRDSISMLDQIIDPAEKHIKIESVRSIIGIPNIANITDLLDATLNGKSRDILDKTGQLYEDGQQASSVATMLGKRIRSKILHGEPHTHELLKLSERLLQVAGSRSPNSLLDIVLLEYSTVAQRGEKGEDKNLKQDQKSSKVVTSETESNTTEQNENFLETPQFTEPESNDPRSPIPNLQSDEPADEPLHPLPSNLQPGSFDWDKLLAHIKSTNNTLYGVLRLASPQFLNNVLHLHFKFGFHKKRVDEAKNMNIVQKGITDLFGINIAVKTSLGEVADSPSSNDSGSEMAQKDQQKVTQTHNIDSKKSDNNPDIQAITNVFGGAEMIES